MVTFIVLAVYIVGVYLAYFQVQKWADHEITEVDECQTAFMLSLLSWMVYPLYGLACIIRNAREE